MRKQRTMQLTASADKSAGPPLNLPSSGVNVIDHCWLGSPPLQGTAMGFAPVSAVVVRPPVRWDRVPETMKNPLRHVRVGVVRVPVTVATPVLGSNWPKRSTLSSSPGVETERFSVPPLPPPTSATPMVGIEPGLLVGLVAVFLACRSVAYVHPISVPSPSDPEL